MKIFNVKRLIFIFLFNVIAINITYCGVVEIDKGITYEKVSKEFTRSFPVLSKHPKITQLFSKFKDLYSKIIYIGKVGLSEVYELNSTGNYRLSWCGCTTFDNDARRYFLFKFLNDILDKFKPEETRKLVITSLCSGGLLQELFCIIGLLILGYKKITINFIDDIYSEQASTDEYEKAFSNVAEAKSFFENAIKDNIKEEDFLCESSFYDHFTQYVYEVTIDKNKKSNIIMLLDPGSGFLRTDFGFSYDFSELLHDLWIKKYEDLFVGYLQGTIGDLRSKTELSQEYLKQFLTLKLPTNPKDKYTLQYSDIEILVRTIDSENANIFYLSSPLLQKKDDLKIAFFGKTIVSTSKKDIRMPVISLTYDGWAVEQLDRLYDTFFCADSEDNFIKKIFDVIFCVYTLRGITSGYLAKGERLGFEPIGFISAYAIRNVYKEFGFLIKHTTEDKHLTYQVTAISKDKLLVNCEEHPSDELCGIAPTNPDVKKFYTYLVITETGKLSLYKITDEKKVYTDKDLLENIKKGLMSTAAPVAPIPTTKENLLERALKLLKQKLLNLAGKLSSTAKHSGPYPQASGSVSIPIRRTRYP